MKKKVTLGILLLSSLNLYSQITKDNWLIGGSGRYSSQKETLNSVEVKGYDIELTPNIGYFLIDKLALGAKSALTYNKLNYNGGLSKSTQVTIGPFVRYYALNPDNRINIFTQASYEYVHYSGNSGAKSQGGIFTISSGPVVFLNSSVGLECTFNYQLLNQKEANTTAKTFYVNLGFQIHLEKN